MSIKRIISIVLVLGLLIGLTVGVFAELNYGGRPDSFGGHYSYLEDGKTITGYVYVKGLNDGWAVKCNGGTSPFSKYVMDKYKPFKVGKALIIENGKLITEVWSVRSWYRYIKPTEKPTLTPKPTGTVTSTAKPTSTPIASATIAATNTPIKTEVPTESASETELPNFTTLLTTHIPTSTPTSTLPQTGEGNNILIIVSGLGLMVCGVLITLRHLKKKEDRYR